MLASARARCSLRQREELWSVVHEGQGLLVDSRAVSLRVETMRIIMEERGYTLKEDPWSDAAVKVLDTEKENVENIASAALECESQKGKGGAHKAQVLFVNEEGGTVLTVAPGVGLCEFAFDTVRRFCVAG
ncbi:hypothetical protein CYMTET_40472 [Cymbomonas tetramitiformis]|uniref:Uncharacterized protein n=1 Tax=Cymbomonas tetramitiformis TaxID=36881 RepID=A0AAE0F4K7_9CHLO|nr:hypothetical protein CYMTET_40472 [Cymbomonas tetramitiformis]